MSASGADPGFHLEVPVGWITRDDVAPFALVATPADRHGGFTANLTVLDARSEAAAQGFDAYAGAQLAGIARDLAEPVLVAVDRVRQDGGTPALDLVCAHAVAGHDVTMVQRHLLTGGDRAVVASATAADGQWPDVAALLTRAVRSLRATES
ncbi:hypothetical protein BH20ACT2_BH20ACT2_08170 [soil metagenome]